MAAHTYWRINVSANNGSGFLQIAEIEMRIAYGGVDQCTGGTATASGQFSSFAPSLAFDNDNATRWCSNISTGWIRYQFSSPVDIIEYTIRAHTADNASAPRDWTFEYSDDGTNWTVAETRTGYRAWVVSETRTMRLLVPGNTRIWRLDVSANNGASDGVQIAEVQYHETVGGPDVINYGQHGASSETSTRESWYAQDNSASTFWLSSAGTSGYWQYTFAEKLNFLEYSIQAGTSFLTRSPNAWQLKYSDDGGTNWTVVDSRSGQTAWGSNEIRTFLIPVGSFSNFLCFFNYI